jgi:hypothetical protein
LSASGPAVEQLLTASQTWTLSVLALASSVPSGTLVISVIDACEAVARRDPAVSCARGRRVELRH